MILTLQITALVSMIVITGIIIAGFIIFISFYSQIKKQNVLLSDLIDTIKEKNENTDKKEENVQPSENDECSITSNNITSIK